MPKVSVVIPCYNLGSYLDEAIDSILSQSMSDFEIILVDDGSTDEQTKARVAAQAEKGVRVFTTENQGLPATRNYAIQRANGEFITCLDADDKFHRNFLKETTAMLSADPSLGFVTTTAKVFGKTNAYWHCSDYDLRKLLTENVVHVASLFRRQCWEEVGGYATNLTGFQDWNFWLNIVGKGYRWGLVKRPLFLYRDREGSMIKGSEQKRRALKHQIVLNNIELFREHVADVLDDYEANFLEQRTQSHQREVDIAQTALDKLTELYKTHQALKQKHEALCQQMARKGRKS